MRAKCETACKRWPHHRLQSAIYAPSCSMDTQIYVHVCYMSCKQYAPFCNIGSPACMSHHHTTYVTSSYHVCPVSNMLRSAIQYLYYPYMYIYLQIYLWTYPYMYIYLQIYVHIWVCPVSNIDTHDIIHTHTHTHTYTYTYTCMHTCMHTHIHT